MSRSSRWFAISILQPGMGGFFPAASKGGSQPIKTPLGSRTERCQSQWSHWWQQRWGLTLLSSTVLTHLSYMLPFVSGALACSNIRSSQPMYTSMFIGVMWAPLIILPRTENLRITQWWRIFILARGVWDFHTPRVVLTSSTAAAHPRRQPMTLLQWPLWIWTFSNKFLNSEISLYVFWIRSDVSQISNSHKSQNWCFCSRNGSMCASSVRNDGPDIWYSNSVPDRNRVD